MISRFDDLVWQAADSYPPPLSMSRDQWFALINSIIQKESTFNPDAVSYTGAGIGLMQVNPNIWLSVYNVTRDALFDPWTNISIGVQIARDYIRRFGTSAGLGAYFAGPANRLSYASQAYARTVLSIYSTLFSRFKSLFTTSMPKPGEFYFLPQPSGEPLITVVNLPEAGEEMPEENIYPEYSTPYSEDYTWPILVGVGLALLWIKR